MEGNVTSFMEIILFLDVEQLVNLRKTWNVRSVDNGFNHHFIISLKPMFSWEEYTTLHSGATQSHRVFTPAV